MPKYRLTYGSTSEFHAQGPGEVVPYIQKSHYLGDDEEHRFMRRLAGEMVEWNRGTYWYTSRGRVAKRMVREGLL